MKRRIRIVRITHLYESILRLLVRFKTPVFLIVILGFGLPLFLLPFKTEKPRENLWVNLYNHTFGSEIYQQKIKKIADPLLGGTLRLFVNNVHRNPFFTDKERTTLYVRAHLSEGAILEQMNAMFLQLEHYLGQFQQIDQFVTNISGPNQAALYITFKQPCENTGFPIVLQNLLINKAIDFGSADWRIYGRGDAFNNSTREQVGRYKIDLYGYNYDALSTHASVLKKQLLNNPRVQEVDVMGKDRWFRDNLHEYVLREDKEKLFIKNSYITSLYKDIKLGSDSREYGGTVTIKNKQYPYVLSSLSSKQFTTWKLQHDAFTSSNGFQKINDVAVVQKEKTSKTIYKKNQQYYLLVAYDFIGPDQLGLMHYQTTVEDFSRELPVGYTAKKQGYRGGGSENRNTYWFIFLVVVIIYFICATLLESLWQPLAIIAMIPVTFIGVFLTFYVFDLAFDEGGYTSFVLLCGLTVNAALYIINELNNLRRQFQHRAFQKDFSFQMYLKAFNSKIVPALLAIASTILGLIPFLAAGQQEIFWFPLAAGTTGGLIFSLVGIFGVLPLFFIKRRIGSKKAPGESINYKDKP